MKSVYIIGGGESLNDINKDLLRQHDLIVINKTIFDFPTAKYFITMDYSFLKKIFLKFKEFKNHPATKIFIVNYTPEYLQDFKGNIIDKRTKTIYDLKDFDVIIKSRSTEGFGKTFKHFCNGENSGYCALQFALLLKYEEINLIGIDLLAENNTHYHTGYGENIDKFRTKLDRYYNHFEQGLLELYVNNPNIKIYNCSKTSRLNNILPYKELI